MKEKGIYRKNKLINRLIGIIAFSLYCKQVLARSISIKELWPISKYENQTLLFVYFDVRFCMPK